MEKVYDYYAFISYKHEDEKWAKWLQKRLENYRLPAAIRKKNTACPKRLKPICRDKTDMSPGELEKEMKEKLDSSRYLIVICSKNLAKESKYVDFEIKTFIEKGMSDRIIPFVVDGEPNSDDPAEECFNNILKNMPIELLAADAKKDGKYIASLKVVAAILNLSADTLIERDKKRQSLRKIIASVTAVLMAVILYFMLGLVSDNFEKEAVNANMHNNTADAIKHSINSLSVPFNRSASGDAAQILRSEVIGKELSRTNFQFHKEFEIIPPHERVLYFAESEDGSLIGFTDYSHVAVYDSKNGAQIGIYSLSTDKEKLEEMFGAEDDSNSSNLHNIVYGENPKKHKEKISDGVLSVSTLEGKTEAVYEIDAENAEWTYTENEDIIAVSEGEKTSEIIIYSFEDEKEISLSVPEKYVGVSEMYFSPKGRYLFVSFYTKDAEGSYLSFSEYIFDIENRQIVFEQAPNEGDDYFVFSRIKYPLGKQSLYLISDGKVEKYSFTDKTPDFNCSDDSKNISDENLINKHNALEGIFISDDGKRAVAIYHTYENDDYDGGKTLYNFFELKKGKLNMSVAFNIFEDIIAITPDAKYAILYMDYRVKIYDIENCEELYEDENIFFDEICSVGISGDGSCAAYINEYGEVTVLKKKEGEYVSETVTEFDYNEENKVILAVNNEKCVYAIGDVYSYNFETGETKKIENQYGYETTNLYASKYCVFKSERLLKDNLFLNVDPIDGMYLFYDIETGEDYPSDVYLLPCDYSDETGLFAGTEYTNQEQYNSEIVVMNFDKNNKKELYRYMSNIKVDDIKFDNEGKYIIINGEDACEVLDALTGELLFTLDRNILIHNDVVYDVSSDLILPDALPYAKIYSLKDFIREGKKIIK